MSDFDEAAAHALGSGGARRVPRRLLGLTAVGAALGGGAWWWLRSTGAVAVRPVEVMAEDPMGADTIAGYQAVRSSQSPSPSLLSKPSTVWLRHWFRGDAVAPEDLMGELVDYAVDHGWAGGEYSLPGAWESSRQDQRLDGPLNLLISLVDDADPADALHGTVRVSLTYR
ncbi:MULTISPECIES: hypothetical protein [unclassified Actinomyces]|uniref:hypothetical protein n=1 Tax=unclassified Actinomyces TaxID=2609248 RepID=UPI000D5966B2|nr:MULTISPECIES: hypothetical protein [unclassified Actinomyces]RAX22590.1 hypothetical protein DRB07_07935 [Actinomyces sp. Z3]